MPEEAASSRFDELLASGFASQLLAAESEELERLLPSERAKVDSELERQKRHDDLLTVAASAFAPGGRLRRETGYEFITCEPLVELKEQGCKSFDVLVANREQGVGIFPECKSSIANPGPEIGDLYATISDLESRVEYLEKRTGVPLKRREYVFCVPAGEFDGLSRAIAQKEEAGEVDPQKQPPIKIWYVNKFKGLSLSLLTQMRHRDEKLSQHLDPNLTRILAAGYEIADELSVGCFPSSHPLVKASAALVSAHRKRGGDLSEFSLGELEEALSSFTVIPHYDINNLGPRIALELSNHLEALGLLKRKDAKLVLQVKGKSIETVLKRLEKSYAERKAENSARERARAVAVEKVLGRYRRFE